MLNGTDRRTFVQTPGGRDRSNVKALLRTLTAACFKITNKRSAANLKYYTIQPPGGINNAKGPGSQ